MQRLRTVLVIGSACTFACSGTAGAQTAQQIELPPVVVQSPPPKSAPPTKARAKGAAASPSQASSGGSGGSGGGAAADASATQGGGQVGDPGTALVGVAGSASQGIISQERLEALPIYRTGELLETVPGLVVTQHSGEGKANQYFLRGFNLDHGTDLAITVDGMPVSMRTHGHGQGYADTNFLIPEIVRSLAYRKGPYFAEYGDFASAGAIDLDIVDRLPKNFAQLEIGSFGHRRAVGAASVPTGLDGVVLAAVGLVHIDGPWERPDDLKKLNAVLRWSRGTIDNGFAVTGMAYKGSWFATDQVPARAVDSGLISRFGTLDPTDGGETERFSLSGRWSRKTEHGQTRVSAYAVRSSLDLFNNFTYVSRDPVNGDQFQQTDRRTIFGGAASHTFFSTGLTGLKTETTVGVQARYDDIRVGLFNTRERALLSTVRDDAVEEASIGAYVSNVFRWTPWLRTIAGLRVDRFAADVESNNPLNSGSDSQALGSPKLGLVLGPWAKTELYLSAGQGFHSNDARGTVITVDPTDGVTPAQRVPFLVRSKGAEVGIRTEPVKGFSSTLAAFVLDFDSEIVFVGDAGTTEASRPSRRVGAEFTLLYKVLPWLTIDIDAAYTRARFTEDDPLAPGRHIPGATEGVVSAGFSFENVMGGWFGGAKIRYFGPRPLIEDNSVRSEAVMPVSARLGYRFEKGLSIRVDGFNLLGEKGHQIDYFYASRLPGEAGDVDDIHFHPMEPRSFRLVLNKQF